MSVAFYRNGHGLMQFVGENGRSQIFSDGSCTLSVSGSKVTIQRARDGVDLLSGVEVSTILKSNAQEDFYIDLEDFLSAVYVFFQGGSDYRIFTPVGSVIHSTEIDAEIFKGRAFTVRKHFTLAAGATVNLVFDPTAVTSPSKYVNVLPPHFLSVGGSGAEVKYLVGSEYSGGTQIVGENRSQLYASNIPLSTITQNATITTPGAESNISWYIASTETNQASSAAAASSEYPYVLDTSKVQHLQITNLDGVNDQIFEYEITWFEFEI